MVESFEDAFLTFSEGQMSALHAYWSSRDDPEREHQIRYHLDAWDRHYNRPSTIESYERYRRARKRWDGYIFNDGAGI